MASASTPDDRRKRVRSSERSRRPERSRSTRPGGAATAQARVREGLRAKRLAGAARALGLSSTRRAAVAALVVCALAFTLAVPLRTYLSQRAEVAEQQELKERLQREVGQLERTKAELADPTQIEAEARRRLRYVMPGEVPFIVQLPGDPAAEAAREAAQRRLAGQAWYEQLWQGVAQP